ncbi:hypothetical protein NQ315_013303 [Exocentrus adspersus]|uniref:Uncharacterized protein n=1 Tax=Exocentrus adspersus TaxID=1586481 RepID=A0AAV8VGX8_9CUCU|nr:hypothetical protein NQ315_013303 [Exocentrus adspersus]
MLFLKYESTQAQCDEVVSRLIDEELSKPTHELPDIDFDDTVTLHSGEEEPIFTLPYTDQPINVFKHH